MPVPAGVVTCTSTVPWLCAGVTAMIDVGLLTLKLAAGVPPNVTDVASLRSVPLMTTLVPPLVDPVLGETDVTVGLEAS